MDETQPDGYICMAVYRPGRELLRRQIASLQAQTLASWRGIVGIDGADADARAEVEAAIAGDARFEIVEFPDNVGFYRNFERILHHVPHDAGWVALADQDDEWFPDKIERLIAALGDADLAFGQVLVTTPEREAEGTVSRRRVVGLAADMIDNQITGSACVFRGSLLDVALPFPEPTDLAFHDHWLGVCALAGRGVAAVHDPLQLYIQHGGNVIGEEERRSLVSRIASTIAKSRRSGGGSLQYLSEHRWGWRVSMSRRLLAGDAALTPSDRAVVAAFAHGTLSPALVRIVGRAVLSRQAPPARAVGLLLGSTRRPRSAPRR